MSAPEPMATPAEVSAVLKVAVQTLAQWRCQGRGPVYHKAGRLVRYTWTDVRRFQREQRKAAA